MQKSIIVPAILMLLMIVPAFGMPQNNNVDYNQIPVERVPTVISNNHEPTQELESNFTGNITAGELVVDKPKL